MNVVTRGDGRLCVSIGDQKIGLRGVSRLIADNPTNKVWVIGTVRELFGIGLIEAKQVVDFVCAARDLRDTI